MVVNRVGDLGVVIAILVIFDLFNTLNYGSVFALVPYLHNMDYSFLNFSINSLDLISLLLFHALPNIRFRAIQFFCIRP